jgi:hypothetical protein
MKRRLGWCWWWIWAASCGDTGEVSGSGSQTAGPDASQAGPDAETPTPVHMGEEAGASDPCAEGATCDGSSTADGGTCAVADCEADAGAGCAGADCTCSEGYVPAEDGSACAPLPTALDIAGATLTPAFSPEHTRYDVALPFLRDTLAITAEAPAGVSLHIAGAAVASGSTWEDPDLVSGERTLTVELTRDGYAARTLTLHITHGAPEPHYIKAEQPSETDLFGSSAALSADGSTLAIGTLGEDGAIGGIDAPENVDGVTDTGAVQVYRREGGRYVREVFIKASRPRVTAQFGTHLALSADGDTLAVTSPYESSGARGIDGDEADTSAFGSGAVFLYRRSSAGWAQAAYVKASNASRMFGGSVALSADGTLLVVGAPFESGASSGVNGSEASDPSPTGPGASSGAAYVFAATDAGLRQIAYLKASNPSQHALFGSRVAVSADGRVIAVAAPEEPSAARGIDGDQRDTSAVRAGAVYLFEHTAGSVRQTAYVKPSNTGAGDGFGGGLSLSADGSTLVVSACAEDGAARGVDGDPNDDGRTDSGAVYVFEQTDTGLLQTHYLKAPNADANDALCAVSLSDDGRLLAVGAVGEASGADGLDGDSADNSVVRAGAVYFFRRRDETWEPAHYVKSPYSAADDRLGSAVYLSRDGSTLAVSSQSDDAAAGVDPTQYDPTMRNAGALIVVR